MSFFCLSQSGHDSTHRTLKECQMFASTKSFKAIFVGIITFMVSMYLVSVAMATDSYGSPSNPKPVAPECTQGNCEFTPAVPTVTVVSPEQTVTSYTYNEVRELVATYELRTDTIVAIYMAPRGIPSQKGCVNPIRKGWIKAGQAFRNTRANGTPFWDTWEKGWMVCNATRVKIGKFFYMKGDKANCGNRNILIPLGQAKKIKRPIKRSIEVATWKEAVRISVTTTTTTTPAVKTTTYFCPKGQLVEVDGAQMCKICPPPACECPKGSSPVGKTCKSDDKPVNHCSKGDNDDQYTVKSYSDDTDDYKPTTKPPVKPCPKDKKHDQSNGYNPHKDQNNHKAS